MVVEIVSQVIVCLFLEWICNVLLYLWHFLKILSSFPWALYQYWFHGRDAFYICYPCSFHVLWNVAIHSTLQNGQNGPPPYWIFLLPVVALSLITHFAVILLSCLGWSLHAFCSLWLVIPSWLLLSCSSCHDDYLIHVQLLLYLSGVPIFTLNHYSWSYR